MYEIRSPTGWPQMVLVIFGKDYFGRSVARGYGNFHLPSAPGTHVRKVKIFDVLPPSNVASCCAFLMGYINELKQPERVLLEGDGGRECLKVKPMG
jgi:B9 domain-containing protein 1